MQIDYFSSGGTIMRPVKLSTCFCTDNINACRDFYVKYFFGKIVFDCGWYVDICLGENGPGIQFMEPQGDMSVFRGEGVTLNIMVDDVDAEHDRLIKTGLVIKEKPEDHPWGDRGFSVTDPIGNNISLYTEIEVSEEYRQYFR